MVRLLVDMPNIGKQDERVELVADRASRQVDNGKAVLDPPDQEWPS